MPVHVWAATRKVCASLRLSVSIGALICPSGSNLCLSLDLSACSKGAELMFVKMLFGSVSISAHAQVIYVMGGVATTASANSSFLFWAPCAPHPDTGHSRHPYPPVGSLSSVMMAEGWLAQWGWGHIFLGTSEPLPLSPDPSYRRFD